MKDISRDTQQFDSLQNELNKAIDNMNIDQIEENLAKLSAVNPLPYELGDSKLFAKRIINQNKRGNTIMKKNYKKFGTLAASALLMITIGTTAAYATGLLNNFTFFNKDTTVTVKTNQELSSKEAEELAKDAASNYGKPLDPQSAVSEVAKKDFSDIAEIKKAFGIDIAIPSYIPTDFEMDKEIHTETMSDQNFNIYTTYTSKENKERRFGITVIKDVIPEGSTSVVVTDSVYKDDYTTPSGTHYTLLDEDGSIIAQTEVNDIQYGLVFMGVSKDEIHKVIDSADLSSYTK